MALGPSEHYSLLLPEDLAQSLAARCRELRLMQGWKQATLSKRSGVSLSSLRRFETSGQASLKNLLRLAFALGRLDDFADLLEPPPARSLDELQRLRETARRQRGRL